MQYTEFIQCYPFLNTLLVEWAAHRIARTADYLESEARSRISSLQSQIEGRKIQMPLTKQIFAEFLHGIPAEEFERLAWATDEEYRYLHSLLLEAKYRLSEIKATTVTPSIQQIPFRARLEPKPWRVVADQIHKVCHYLGTFGTAPENSTSVVIRAIHDTWCLGNGSLA